MSFHISLRWRSGDHLLLQGAALVAIADGVGLPTRVTSGIAAAEVPENVTELQLILTFQPRVGVRTAEVLRIDQTLRNPRPGTSLPVLEAVTYQILSGPGRVRLRIPGLHPLLQGFADDHLGISLTIPVRSSLVDVTGLVPNLPALMQTMGPRAAGAFASSVRILARTDGTLPQLWLVATPTACRGAEFTDVLAFLGPSQNHAAPPSLEDQLTDATATTKLVAYAAIMFGSGTHAGGPLGAQSLDHFTGVDFILAKGLEGALVASRKHAILAIPVPANRSHNAAATAALPALLTDVHRVITAVGDAHPSVDPSLLDQVLSPVAVPPRFALAAHSRGGLALWGEPDPGQSGPFAATTRQPGALRAAPEAYTDLLLFEALYVGAHLDALARTDSTRVVFVGYDRATVSGPMASARRMAKLRDRVQRFPLTPSGGPEPEDASLAELARRSPSLNHALSTLTTSPTHPDNLFALKHQLCTWSGDQGGSSAFAEMHFLTQVLLGSGLR